ncbi:MAG: hypothetical protein AB2792_18125 [Candidatus Thiodiazotropha sp.]
MNDTYGNGEIDQMWRDKIGCRYAVAIGTGITATTPIIAQLPTVATVTSHVSGNSSRSVCVMSHSFMRLPFIAWLDKSSESTPEWNQVQRQNQ